jgi:hypothetical protein
MMGGTHARVWEKNIFQTHGEPEAMAHAQSIVLHAFPAMPHRNEVTQVVMKCCAALPQAP